MACNRKESICGRRNCLWALVGSIFIFAILLSHVVFSQDGKDNSAHSLKIMQKSCKAVEAVKEATAAHYKIALARNDPDSALLGERVLRVTQIQQKMDAQAKAAKMSQSTGEGSSTNVESAKSAAGIIGLLMDDMKRAYDIAAKKGYKVAMAKYAVAIEKLGEVYALAKQDAGIK